LLLSHIKRDTNWSVVIKLIAIFLVIAAISGFFMMIKFEAIESIVKIAYTIFDLSVLIIAILSIIKLISNHFKILTEGDKMKS
jgi:hypothetical protein